MNKITVSADNWLGELPRYPFVELRQKKEALKKKGIEVFDFSIGDPTSPTPGLVLEAAQQAMRKYQASGYPDNRGLGEFRSEVTRWLSQRFGVTVNADSDIFPSIGAKEAVFAFPRVIEGEGVLVPTPGYPPYYSGAKAAGKKVFLYSLLPQNRFLPDLDSIPQEVARQAKIFWINYPNNPTTVLATGEFYRKLIEFCRSYDIIIASDECYSEMYQDRVPESILQYGKEGIIVFQSLSKRSNMTGWRVGYMAGDPDIIKIFLSAKENMDSGCANFVQAAAIAALRDEAHVEEMRREYSEKRTIMRSVLQDVGLKEGFSDGTFYIWQPVPEKMTSGEFAGRLLEEDMGIVVTPGPALAYPLPDGSNPGEGFVRFALVPTKEQTLKAAERLRKANPLKKHYSKQGR